MASWWASASKLVSESISTFVAAVRGDGRVTGKRRRPDSNDEGETAGDKRRAQPAKRRRLPRPAERVATSAQQRQSRAELYNDHGRVSTGTLVTPSAGGQPAWAPAGRMLPWRHRDSRGSNGLHARPGWRSSAQATSPPGVSPGAATPAGAGSGPGPSTEQMARRYQGILASAQRPRNGARDAFQREAGAEERRHAAATQQFYSQAGLRRPPPRALPCPTQAARARPALAAEPTRVPSAARPCR